MTERSSASGRTYGQGVGGIPDMDRSADRHVPRRDANIVIDGAVRQIEQGSVGLRAHTCLSGTEASGMRPKKTGFERVA